MGLAQAIRVLSLTGLCVAVTAGLVLAQASPQPTQASEDQFKAALDEAMAQLATYDFGAGGEVPGATTHGAQASASHQPRLPLFQCGRQTAYRRNGQ